MLLPTGQAAAGLPVLFMYTIHEAIAGHGIQFLHSAQVAKNGKSTGHYLVSSTI